MKNKIKNNKGITLIALIITIVVLLILAVVSINLVINEGLIFKTKDATIKHKVAEINEALKLILNDEQICRSTRKKNSEDRYEPADETLYTDIKESALTPEGQVYYGLGNIYDKSTGELITENLTFFPTDLIYDRDGILDVPEELKYKFINTKVDIGNNGYIQIVGEIGSVPKKDTFAIDWDYNLYYIDNDGNIYSSKTKYEADKIYLSNVPYLSPEEELDLLERYFLGENGETRLLTDVLDTQTYPIAFKDIEGAIIPNGSKVLTFLSTSEDSVFFKYGKRAYKLQCNGDTLETMQNQAVEFVYEPKGREGEKIKYSHDGTIENEKYWTIIYDYGDSVEIVSPEAMGSLTLGYKDEEAQTPGDVDKDGNSNTDVDKAIYSYNNAISRINNYTSSLITNTNKISVRSAGSNPEDPTSENNNTYKSDKLASWVEGRYNGLGKDADTNSEQDLIRMGFWGVTGTGKYTYFLASRNVKESSNEVMFFIEHEISYGGMYLNAATDLWTAFRNGADYSRAAANTCPVRPIVKIKY